MRISARPGTCSPVLSKHAPFHPRVSILLTGRGGSVNILLMERGKCLNVFSSFLHCN